MKTAILFHDGCNICLAISETLSDLINKSQYAFESINLGINKEKGQEAKAMGVQRLPSLIIDGEVMEINDHSSIDDYIV